MEYDQSTFTLSKNNVILGNFQRFFSIFAKSTMRRKRGKIEKLGIWSGGGGSMGQR